MAKLLLIVIPAFNEEKSLGTTIPSLDQLRIPFEVVIVNDGSCDQTLKVARQLAAKQRFPVHVVGLSMNCGIGTTVQTGYRFAAESGKYHYVLQFDADGQHDPRAIPAFLKACDDQNADLVIGSRFLEHNQNQFRSSFPRRIGIGWLSWLMSFLMGQRITDPTSGFRCAGPNAWALFARHYPDDYPEPESIVYVWRQGLKIVEIPVQMFARHEGVSSIGSLRGAYYMIKVSLAVILARWRRRNGI